MHALAFALDTMAHSSAEKRPQQEEIVSTLLSYGADPRAAQAVPTNTTSEDGDEAVNPLIRSAEACPFSASADFVKVLFRQSAAITGDDCTSKRRR